MTQVASGSTGYPGDIVHVLCGRTTQAVPALHALIENTIHELAWVREGSTNFRVYAESDFAVPAELAYRISVKIGPVGMHMLDQIGRGAAFIHVHTDERDFPELAQELNLQCNRTVFVSSHLEDGLLMDIVHRGHPNPFNIGKIPFLAEYYEEQCRARGIELLPPTLSPSYCLEKDGPLKRIAFA